MALFSSVNDALLFAFKRSTSSPGQSSHLLAPLMQRSRLADEGPADAPIRALDTSLERVPPGLDRAAQQSLLQAFCIRQKVPRNLHLLSKFAHGETQRAARRALRDFVMRLLRKAATRYVVYALIGLYYRRKDVNLKELAYRLQHVIERKDGETEEKHFRRALRHTRELAREVEDWLSQIGSQAEEAAFEQLQAQGVVG